MPLIYLLAYSMKLECLAILSKLPQKYRQRGEAEIQQEILISWLVQPDPQANSWQPQFCTSDDKSIDILHMPSVLTCYLWFQVEGTPKKHVAEEFEEFDYSDLYGHLSISTVTAGPNLTDYEVRLTIRDWLRCSLYCLSLPVSVLNLQVCRV